MYGNLTTHIGSGTAPIGGQGGRRIGRGRRGAIKGRVARWLKATASH